jgi:hypothetical protein
MALGLELASAETPAEYMKGVIVEKAKQGSQSDRAGVQPGIFFFKWTSGASSGSNRIPV